MSFGPKQSKKSAFKSCRDVETSWEQLKELKSSRPAGDKDANKLEKSCRKMEESLMKIDREYRESNIKTEQARLSWEASMYQCCKVGVVNMDKVGVADMDKVGVVNMDKMGGVNMDDVGGCALLYH